MRNRSGRWILFLLTIVFLIKSVFGEATTLSVGGFFVCGMLWYWRALRRTRELDASAPRKPFSPPRAES